MFKKQYRVRGLSPGSSSPSERWNGSFSLTQHARPVWNPEAPPGQTLQYEGAQLDPTQTHLISQECDTCVLQIACRVRSGDVHATVMWKGIKDGANPAGEYIRLSGVCLSPQTYSIIES